MENLPDNATPAPAYLEHYPEPGGAVQRLALERFPFRIGRSQAAGCTIYSTQVSKEHAEVFRRGEEFGVRDLGSTNGTFLNGQRVAEALLCDGDILHVADKEFRFGRVAAGQAAALDSCHTQAIRSRHPSNLLQGGEHLRELLRRSGVSILFQPIVYLDTQEILGYEALGRGAHEQLSANPLELFDLAEKLRLAEELSVLFRRMAVREAEQLPGSPYVFLNLHPLELKGDSLWGSLAELLPDLPERQCLVLEVHEDAVTDKASLGRLRERLNDMGIGLAYDDFGAGQARLAELAEVPPDFLKLDMNLIREVDQARGRQKLIQALYTVSQSLGVQLIAEGIETREEADVCLRLGCHLGQGYLFGRPQPVAACSAAVAAGAATPPGS